MEIILNNINNKVFSDLNLKFNSNVITGIIGDNKTILLNIISGLSKYEGNIINNNTISYFNGLIDYNKTAYEILDIENSLFNITDILKVLNFDLNKLDTKLSLLSDSEVKKVIIGFVLIQNKDLYLLDNPNNLLDNKSQSLLIKFLRNLKVKYNKTVLLTSSDIDFLHEVSDDILLLTNNPIIGNKYNIFTNEKLMKSYNYELPKIIDISNVVYKNKNIKMGYRDDIKDLIKDIYRYAK